MINNHVQNEKERPNMEKSAAFSHENYIFAFQMRNLTHK